MNNIFRQTGYRLINRQINRKTNLKSYTHRQITKERVGIEMFELFNPKNKYYHGGDFDEKSKEVIYSHPSFLSNFYN